MLWVQLQIYDLKMTKNFYYNLYLKINWILVHNDQNRRYAMKQWNEEAQLYVSYISD